MEQISKEDYINALEVVKTYEEAIILNNGIPCYIIYDFDFKEKPVMVFTDKDLAERIKSFNGYSHLLEVKLYQK